MDRLSRITLNGVSGLLLLVLVYAGPAWGQEKCEPCSAAQQKAEYEQLYDKYRDAVRIARSAGFRCADDPDYNDPGGGAHTAGNCADWQRVTWEALVQQRWNCWSVTKIQARRKFSVAPPIYHHFVSLTPKCGGKRIYLDPWETGVAVAATERYFRFAGGVFSWWIHYPLDRHGAGTAGRLIR